MPIYVRVDFEIRVELPEGIPDEWDGQDESCPPTLRERAIEAAMGGFGSDYADVYIDGEDKEPVRVYNRCTYMDVTEVRAEE